MADDVSGTAFAVAVRDVPLVAVLRGLSAGAATAVGQAAVRGGLRAVEVTMDSPGAAEAIAALVAAVPAGVAVGAGTVVTDTGFDRAVAAGAQFLVAPHLDAGLVGRAAAADIPFVPGVVSPTELHAAVAAGAPMVKLFPAAPLGPGYLAALRGPYPDVEIMVSGGVAVHAVTGWLRAGATVVGIGLHGLGRTAAEVEEGARRLAGLAAEVTR